MQTITLEVKDNYLNNTLEILHGLKDIMIDKITVKENEQFVRKEEDDFITLSNSSLEQIWDNKEDLIYDKFLK